MWNDPSTWNTVVLSADALSYVQGFGNFNINIPTNGIGTWLQDDWKVTRKPTLNLGLRYDNDLSIFDPNLHLTSGFQTPHYNDSLVFQTRVGFAWHVTGSRRTVIPGDGLFYADIQANQVIDQQIFNGQASLQPALQATANNPINLAALFRNHHRLSVPFRCGTAERADHSTSRSERSNAVFASAGCGSGASAR